MQTQKAIFKRNYLFQTIVFGIHVSFFWGVYLFISEDFNDIFLCFSEPSQDQRVMAKICDTPSRSEPEKSWKMLGRSHLYLNGQLVCLDIYTWWFQHPAKQLNHHLQTCWYCKKNITKLLMIQKSSEPANQLLMEGILNNHLGCIQPCKQWDKVPTSTGAWFLLSKAGISCHYISIPALRSSFQVSHLSYTQSRHSARTQTSPKSSDESCQVEVV